MRNKRKRSMIRLLNYTPHPITVRYESDDKPDLVFPSDGELRCTGSSQTLLPEWSDLCKVPVRTAPEFVGLDYTPRKQATDDAPSAADGGKSSGTPSQDFTLKDDGGTGIIVSMVVGEYLRKHPTLWSGPVFTPDTGTGSVMRDEGGRIVAVRRFCMYKGRTLVMRKATSE